MNMHFVDTSLMLAFLRDSNTSASVIQIEQDCLSSNENYSLKEPLLLAHFKSFRYSDGEQPFCL